MNGNTPNEIVRALRVCNQPKGHRCSECPVFSRYEHTACKATVDRLAADLIESQAAEIARHNAAVTAEGFADVQTMIARYKQVMYDANEISISQDEEIEELRERLTALRDAQTTHYCVNCEDVARRLAEAERGERSAMEALCDCCKRYAKLVKLPTFCQDCEWRGPQEAEGQKGEDDGTAKV